MASRTSRMIRLVLVVALTAFVPVACSGTDDSDQSSATSPGSGKSGATATTAPVATIPPLGDKSVVIAHRGASAYAPEHTFAAYDLALDQGADYIEQDIQLTSDGQLVVMHDETLDRTARGPEASCTGLVRTKTLAQLRECDVGSWFNEAKPELANPTFVGQQIPTLRELFERYGSRARFYIETKAPEAQPGLEQALLDMMDEFGLTEPAAQSNQVIIQSFSAASLQLIHDRRPDLPLVLLTTVSPTPIPASELDDAVGYAMGIGPNSVNIDPTLIGDAHERCLVVHAWTVDDPATITTFLEDGVDGMFTNTPDVLVAKRDAAPPSAKLLEASRCR